MSVTKGPVEYGPPLYDVQYGGNVWIGPKLDALTHRSENWDALIAERDALAAEVERLREFLCLSEQKEGWMKEQLDELAQRIEEEDWHPCMMLPSLYDIQRGHFEMLLSKLARHAFLQLGGFSAVVGLEPDDWKQLNAILKRHPMGISGNEGSK